MISSSKTILIVIVILGILFLTLVGFAETTDMSVSLEDCIVRAMEQNLGVAVELYNPGLADAGLSQAREQFYPTMALSYGRQSTSSASFSWIDAEDQIQADFSDYSARLTQLIPTGGAVSDLPLFLQQRNKPEVSDHKSPFRQHTDPGLLSAPAEGLRF